MDWGLVAATLAGFNILLSLWLFRQIIFTVRSLVQDLDSNLGVAISKLVQDLGSGLADFEPVSPIQQAIAQMLIGKIEQSPIEAIITDRGADGKFAKIG